MEEPSPEKSASQVQLEGPLDLASCSSRFGEYVDHLKNGYVLSKGDKELDKALTHFLLELKPWNEALIYSIEKIQEYTGQRLIEKWEGWMRERHG